MIELSVDSGIDATAVRAVQKASKWGKASALVLPGSYVVSDYDMNTLQQQQVTNIVMCLGPGPARSFRHTGARTCFKADTS